MRNKVVLDFETYFDRGYSLRVLPTILYVRSTKFQIHGVGVKANDEDPVWMTDLEELRNLLRELSPITVIGHNLLFDGLILVERIGVEGVDILWQDTLSMARGLITTDDYSLGTLAAGLTYRRKLDGILSKTDGKRVLSRREAKQLAEYCLADCEATRALYEVLEPLLPETEKELIHITTEMGVRGQLWLNGELLATSVQEEIAARDEAIRDSGVPKEVLSSNVQFAAWLMERGYSPPVKISMTTEKETWAFAKGDASWDRFKEEHQELKKVFQGREAAKSTIGIDRAQVLYEISQTGSLPVPLKYYGGHTGRFSGGGGGINLQNLPRQGNIRRSIHAGEGRVLVIADYAQIEARVIAWLAGEEYLLEAFAQNKDVYRVFAAKLHNCKEDQITKEQRQKAKSMVLGLGFGMGARKFSDVARVSLEEAEESVRAYRQINARIVGLWKSCGDALDELCLASELGLKDFSKPWLCMNLELKAIRLPNGMHLKMPYLHRDGDETSFAIGQKVEKIYAGKLAENVTQALARIIMTEALVKAWRAGINPVFTCHDEIVLSVEEDAAEHAVEALKGYMEEPIAWAPGLKLAAEIKVSKCYDK